MTVLDVLTAIQNSALAHAISKTDHLVAAGLQIVHVLGLIFFLASLVLISLRAVGWALADQPIPAVARDTSRLMWAGLALTALSGTLMFIATPKLYYFNWAFGLKMALLVIAILVQAVLFRGIARRNAPNLRFVRLSVGLCVASWFSVAMAGRMIGFV
jgi:uncharacterized membrane protein (UPF0136 family)